MADPFGITALTVTSLHLAIKLGQLINQLRHAPDELLALSNETCDFKLVLDTVKHALSVPRPVEEEPQGIRPQLFLASLRFEELDAVVARLGQLGPWGDAWHMGTWERLLWRKEKSKIVILQKQMRDIRQNLSLALEANSISATFHIGVDLQDLMSETSRFHSLHAESIMKNKTGIDEIRDTQQETNFLLEALVQSMPQLSYQHQHHEPLALEKVGQIPQYPEKDESPAHITIPALVSQHSSSTCWSDCDCECHKRRTFKTPGFLSDITGRLSVGYNGSMNIQGRCNIPNCHRQSAYSPQLVYMFPRWFLKRAISISVMANQLSPHLSLKVRRVVPEISQLFTLARYGDVEGVQQLFSAQKASPDDVHVVGGWTALHFAVDHGSVELCRLLIEQGADANWEDGIGSTAIDYARRNVLMPRVCARAAEVYAVVISRANHLQERYFSRLHELILGLSAGDVEEEIISHPSSLHHRDIYGWTPLHWAARRGDSTNTALLLRHGANPFLKTLDDECNPVHLAARGDSPSCIKIVLQHAYEGRKISINDWDHRARTALRIGAGNNCFAAATLLIREGAEIDNSDHQNETALLSCVYENAHEAIPLLIKAGADPRVTTRSGNSILHFAASESDLTALALLTKARMRGVAIEAVNTDGFTARDMAARRIGAPVGFLDAFDRLIASIDEMSPSPSPSPDGMESSASTMVSDAESFRSFEELIWHEAERRGMEQLEESDEGSECMDDLEEVLTIRAPSVDASCVSPGAELQGEAIDAHDQLDRTPRAAHSAQTA